tara:strand:+ start:78 stop:662 length:585 start_codon:yes stop_codon:yes gene_type:complete
MSDNIDERYKKGKIYKIIDNTNGNIYIGSTIQTLKMRLYKHKSNYKDKFHNLTSFDIIKNNDYKIELLEHYSCNNKKELETREREYIENNICLNRHIPMRTNKEWREVNKKIINENAKEYREKNRKKLNEKAKVYHKKHRDKIIQYLKQYREKHRKEISEIRKVKVLCEICDCKIRKQHIHRHNRTTKHLNNIK